MTFRNVKGKLANMRKEVEWVIYPPSASRPHIVQIQCDKRIAQLNKETNEVVVSSGKGGHPGFHMLSPAMGAKTIEAPQWLLDQLANLDEDHGKMEAGPVSLTGGSVLART